MKIDKFLVIYEYDSDEYSAPTLTTAGQIFNTMDMSDCYDISIGALYAIVGKDLIECQFLGTHCHAEKLRMEIRTVDTDEVVAVGYGTDH